MTTLSAKIADLFRSLKTDAVPRGAQTQHDALQGFPAVDSVDYSTTDRPGLHDDHAFFIHLDSNSVWKEKKPKTKKTFFMKKCEGEKQRKQEKSEKRDSNDCEVNTQAFITTSPQLNIVNCTRVTYCIPGFEPCPIAPMTAIEPEQRMVEKCEEITALMKAEVKPDHDYLDLISNELGKNWHGFFNLLGFLRGHIDTMENVTREYGVNEARYRLLLDWVRVNEAGTLGCLAAKLWEHGDRRLVKQLAKMYSSKKNSNM